MTKMRNFDFKNGSTVWEAEYEIRGPIWQVNNLKVVILKN
jgi:hypothetical protein